MHDDEHLDDPAEKPWPQLLIAWSDWDTAEDTAARRLYPALLAAEQAGLLDRWFFIRKRPYWRLRYANPDAREHLVPLLETLTADGDITCWTHGLYEPETCAFGGASSMDTAHALFHADSRNVLAHLARQHVSDGPAELGRRELGVLLISAALRGAGLDWYEHGDVWGRIARLRRAGPETPNDQPQRHDVRRLMTANTTQLASDSGPLAPIRDWLDAFESAGREIAEHARHGRLDRGLRAVLAHHGIFAWNRLGLSAHEQKALSERATEVVMTEHTSTEHPLASDADAARLREQLAELLRTQGHVSDERIEDAVRAVPRHVFVPGTPLEQAYNNAPVYTKHEDGGRALSAASQPGIVTMQLAQLGVEPDQRVLELGAGTGYNAGLLAHLVGEHGHVTTLDVDEDLVLGARAHLADAGASNVEVLCQDGALGHPAGAPYDRILATVSTADIPEALLKQAAPDGRLVIPLRIAGSATRSITFERDGDRWTSVDSQLCAFMGLRDSAATDPRRLLDLTGDAEIILHAYREQDVDADALREVFGTPAAPAWSGVDFAKGEPLDPVWLWLACALPGSVSRMETQPGAIDTGLVDPMMPWGSMATVDGESLAYLTTRATEDGHEMGAIGHGPAGKALAEHMASEIKAWSEYRSASLAVEFQPNGTSDATPEPAGPGRFVITRPSGRVTVTWQA